MSSPTLQKVTLWCVADIAFYLLVVCFYFTTRTPAWTWLLLASPGADFGDKLCTKPPFTPCLPPLEVLLVRFEMGIHLEKAAELGNCNIILSVCHGFSRRNQSSTDRRWPDALTVSWTEDGRELRASFYCQETTASQAALCRARPIATCGFQRVRDKRAEPCGAVTQCNFKMTAEGASGASEDDDSGLCEDVQFL